MAARVSEHYIFILIISQKLQKIADSVTPMAPVLILIWSMAVVVVVAGCWYNPLQLAVMQLVLVVISLHQLVQMLHLHSCGHARLTATCVGGVYPFSHCPWHVNDPHALMRWSVHRHHPQTVALTQKCGLVILS